MIESSCASLSSTNLARAPLAVISFFAALSSAVTTSSPFASRNDPPVRPASAFSILAALSPRAFSRASCERASESLIPRALATAVAARSRTGADVRSGAVGGAVAAAAGAAAASVSASASSVARARRERTVLWMGAVSFCGPSPAVEGLTHRTLAAASAVAIGTQGWSGPSRDPGLPPAGALRCAAANAFHQEEHGAPRRHHHERGHRPDGDEPAPHPLDPGDPRAGRRALQRRDDLARAAARRPQRGASSPRWPPSMGSSTGRPTSAPRSPTRRTRSTSTRSSRRRGRRRSRPRSPPASTSTARSRSRRMSRRRWPWRGPRVTRASRSASCRTSCSCPGF